MREDEGRLVRITRIAHGPAAASRVGGGPYLPKPEEPETGIAREDEARPLRARRMRRSEKPFVDTILSD